MVFFSVQRSWISFTVSLYGNFREICLEKNPRILPYDNVHACWGPEYRSVQFLDSNRDADQNRQNSEYHAAGTVPQFVAHHYEIHEYGIPLLGYRCLDLCREGIKRACILALGCEAKR